LIEELEMQGISVINKKPVDNGLVDVLFKLGHCDAIYFNWIEDLPHRKFGALQVGLLLIILILAKTRGIQIIWFIHNNLSHRQDGLTMKRMIRRMMKRFADRIVSHVADVDVSIDRARFSTFDHPIEKKFILPPPAGVEMFDLLIWGTVEPYKGVVEFVQFAKKSPFLSSLRILIAGKFRSAKYFTEVNGAKGTNVLLVNKSLDEDELASLLARSKFVLFTYNSSSVLSSGSLCKTLGFFKQVIGPDAGAFRQLATRGIIKTYKNHENLEQLLIRMCADETIQVKEELIRNYVDHVSWPKFCSFIKSDVLQKS
jgi:beta-1,4-mannosyltransferase